MSTCTIVALGVLILYLMHMQSRTMGYRSISTTFPLPDRNFPSPVHAGAISARIASSPSGMAADAKDVFTDYFKAENVKLMDVKGVSAEKHDQYKTATAAEKEEVQTRMKTVASSSHPAVCMVFSPHCKHCWTTFPMIDKAAKANPDVDFMLINYMALPTAYWEKHFPMEITYFPTMVAKKGTEMQKVPSIEEAVAQVKQTVEADAVASGWASVEGPSLDAPPEEGDTGFMATLF